MKYYRTSRSILLLSILLIIAGCGKTGESLRIGPDGYGDMTLANGIKVVVNQDVTTSLSAARILIGGGVLTDTESTSGLSNLMIRMLLKGNNARSAAEISEQLDFYGATVSASCFQDFTAISITSLTENFDPVLEIIATSLTSPTFPSEELDKLKIEIEGEIKAKNDNQSQASSDLFWKTAYGDAGYGLPTLGSPDGIEKITVDDIREHFQKYVGGTNMVVAVATDLAADQVSAMINKHLGEIKPEAGAVPAPPSLRQTEKEGFIPFDRNQSFVYMGYVLDHLTPEEMAYINLLSQTMGGTVGSRLWDLRQVEKLAYTVYTHWIAGKYVTVFRAAIGTDTTKITQALTSLNREWSKLVADGISEEELADAKVNMKNRLIYGIDRKAVRANNMAFYEYTGYGYRFILDQIEMADRITLADVNGFVKTKLSDERKFLSIVGKK